MKQTFLASGFIVLKALEQTVVCFEYPHFIVRLVKES